MSESSFDDSTRAVKEKIPLVDPVWRPGEVVPLQLFWAKMKAAGGFHDSTLEKWKQRGFRVYKPGTKAGWVSSDDVIRMIQTFEDGEEV